MKKTKFLMLCGSFAATLLSCGGKNDAPNMSQTATCGCTVESGEATKHMVVPGNQWNELLSQLLYFPCTYETTRITKVSSDTVAIDGLTYYRLLAAYDSSASQWRENGFIREDYASQKVYYKSGNKPEYLLYNFQAEVGDTVSLLRYQYNNYDVDIVSVVEAVDSVLTGKTWRKKFTVRLKAFNVPEYSNAKWVRSANWIEGIGCVNNILQSDDIEIIVMPPGSSTYSLFCFFQNGKLIYKHEPTESTITAPHEQCCFVWNYSVKCN
ncbi:MAG: hypothetical protein LBF67_00045 [Prevotellaceae bacterium]|jgi:hypothetical protein|nr:hypothetical protein [Prevotellaceae bacterium]